MEQQNIAWVGVPYSNLEEGKIRPALIISNNEYNSESLDLVICSITSNLEERPYAVFITPANISEGTLPIKSKIRADKIMHVEKKRVGRIFARLNDETFDSVIKEIGKLISKNV